MKTLSPKQQQIYDYIVSFSGLHGYPPSVREIGEYVGLKSPSTVHFHLKGLEAAGLITKAEGKTRAITISGPHPGAPEPAGEEPDQVPVVGSVAAGAPILAQECIEDYLTFDTGVRMAGTPAPRRGPARTHAGERGNFPGRGHLFLRGLPDSGGGGHPPPARRERDGLPRRHGARSPGAAPRPAHLPRPRGALYSQRKGVKPVWS